MLKTVNRTLELFVELIEDDQFHSNRDLQREYHLADNQLKQIQNTTKEIRHSLDSPNDGWGKYFEWVKKGTTFTIRPRYKLSKQQLLFLAKLAAASRALNRSELNKLLDNINDMNQGEIRSIIKQSTASERINKIGIVDDSKRLDKLWTLEEYINDKKWLNVTYIDRETLGKPEELDILPTHTFFDNYYLFLVGFDGEKNRYFRIDWLTINHVLRKKMELQQDKREDFGSEMLHDAYGYPGEKKTITFDYYGFSEYFRDVFPDCEYIGEVENTKDDPMKIPGFPVERWKVNVNYSLGLKLWLLGQSHIMRIVSPEDVVDDMSEILHKAVAVYDRPISKLKK